MLHLNQLPNGCYCSNLSVHPKNWNSPRASIKKKWYIHYRFHDPAYREEYPKGKLRIIKAGVNELHELQLRQEMIESLLEEEWDLLLNQGYNPIAGTMKEPEHIIYEIEPDTPFVDALRSALQKLDIVSGSLDDARSVVKYVAIAAEQLRLHKKPVTEIRCRHLTMILDYMKDRDKNFTNAKYNRYRANLGMIFKKLLKMGAVESNQATLVERKKQIKTIRATLTMEERRRVDDHLREKNPSFHRFMHIFFHSGVRETELLSVRRKDIDLAGQRYKVLLKKGTEYREVYKIIKDIALPLWEEAVAGAGPEDFIFSKGLVPGRNMIHRSQICRRWKLWVKDRLGIQADFYSLKHSNTTEIVDLLDAENAARLNDHTTTAMVVNIYDVKSQQRKNDRLKRVNNSFI